jgi:hypothetical protein
MPKSGDRVFSLCVVKRIVVAWPRKGQIKQSVKQAIYELLTTLLDNTWQYFSTLKMEAVCSSETFVDFRWTTQRCIPDDRVLRIDC